MPSRVSCRFEQWGDFIKIAILVDLAKILYHIFDVVEQHKCTLLLYKAILFDNTNDIQLNLITHDA